jgi:hypothetical protein
VHVADVADREDCALHADQQWAELAGKVVGKIDEVHVLSRMQEHDAGEAGRSVERVDDPVVVMPQRPLDATLAAPAADAAGTVTRRLRTDRRRERARYGRTLERPRVPLLDGRRAQLAVRALPQLFG